MRGRKGMKEKKGREWKGMEMNGNENEKERKGREKVVTNSRLASKPM